MMITNADILRTQTELVVVDRVRVAELKAQMAVRQRQFEEQNAPLLAEVMNATALLMSSEDLLRRLALDLFDETGSKQPAPGIGIRVTTDLRYDPERAYEWARKHEFALKLDVPKFERMAKDTVARDLDFVTREQRAYATIATDLAAALAKAGQ